VIIPFIHTTVYVSLILVVVVIAARGLYRFLAILAIEL